MTNEQRTDYFRKGLSAHALQVLWVLDDHLADRNEPSAYVPEYICDSAGLNFGHTMQALEELVNRGVIRTETLEDGNLYCIYL